MIAVVDYDMGNLGSVVKALECAGGEVRVIDRPAELAHFSGCLLPGVGHFGDGMENLARRGFPAALENFIRRGGILTGICLGMQMLLDSSEEAPGVAGLGIIPGRVRRFPEGSGCKVPHMGWNDIRVRHDHPGADGIADGDYFYFVHSYYAEPADPADVVLECDYILPFAAALGHGNIFATQFHPEKSQDAGLLLLGNFVRRTEAAA